MKSTHNPYGARATRYHRPRTMGGVVVYLLVPPVFVALLAAPGIVLSLLLGFLSGLVVAKLKDSPLLATLTKVSGSVPTYVPGYR